MFEVLVNLKPVGEYTSFNEAFIKFFEEIDAALKEGTSVQWLETANFLVRKDPSGIGVMTFYDARDFAYDIGLMADCKIQKDVAEPAPTVVSQAFTDCAVKRGIAEVLELTAMLEQVLTLVT